MNCLNVVVFVTALIIFCSTIGGSKKLEINSFTIEDELWIDLGKVTVNVLSNCLFRMSATEQKHKLELLNNCLKEKCFKAISTKIQDDVITVLEGVEFIRVQKYKENSTRKTETDMEVSSDWEKLISDKLIEFFRTHVLKIRLENFIKPQEVNIQEARRRHQRHNMMMPLMMFGVVGMGMILIPMGFKFLTILGAKALLLAKMALILSSIQGLKKVATSGINYGLYHSPPANPWHHDRRGTEDIPDEQLDYWHKQTRS